MLISYSVWPRSTATRALVPATGHCWSVPPQETLKNSKAGLAQSLLESLGPGAHKVLFEPSKYLWWVWGLILNVILPFLLSCWGISFALKIRYLFFPPVGSKILLLMVVQQQVAILEKIFTLPSCARLTWSNRQVWPWSTKWRRAKANRVLPRECIGHSKHHLPTTQRITLHMDITRRSIPKSDWLFSLQPKMERLYTVSINKTGSCLWIKSWTPFCKIQTSTEESMENQLVYFKS